MGMIFKNQIAAIILFISSLPVFSVVNSAGGIKKVERPAAEKKAEPAKETPKPEPKKEEPKKETPKVEPKKETPKAEEKKADEEYKRSIGTVNVSQEKFQADKKDILQIVDELSDIMKEKKYKNWLAFIDKESIDYWASPTNLRKAQNRLPVKGLRLRNMEDYFKYVFIPSRLGKSITEIRYVSDSYVKAVEVTEENGELIYYYFNKIGGEWKLHLPPLD